MSLKYAKSVCLFECWFKNQPNVCNILLRLPNILTQTKEIDDWPLLFAMPVQ